jgi:hypothetical protein
MSKENSLLTDRFSLRSASARATMFWGVAIPDKDTRARSVDLGMLPISMCRALYRSKTERQRALSSWVPKLRNQKSHKRMKK